MGIIRTDITLKNAIDVYKAKEGDIKEHEIRQKEVKALVDTGAWTMVINEKIQRELGLGVTRTDTGTLADGTQSMYNIVGPLVVAWKNRSAICEALVLPDAEEALLGAIPLEAMDLTINARNEEIVGAHGDKVVHSVKIIRHGNFK